MAKLPKPVWEMRTDHIKNTITLFKSFLKKDRKLPHYIKSMGFFIDTNNENKNNVKLLEQELEYRKNPDYLAFFRKYYNTRDGTCLLVWADWCDDNNMVERAAEFRKAANF